MEFETKLAVAVRTAVKGAGTIREIKMFGGIGFMLNGNLVAAASKRGLLARVGEVQQAAALEQRGAQPMIMRGRTMQGYIYVKAPDITAPVARKLLKLAIHFVRMLPPKTPRGKSKSPKKNQKKAPPQVVKPRVQLTKLR